MLPLVPAYIGYMGGRMTRQVSVMGQTQAARSRFQTFTHGVFFVLGFTLFFVLFGLLTTAVADLARSDRYLRRAGEDAIARIGGTAVIPFGLHIMGVLPRADVAAPSGAPA